MFENLKKNKLKQKQQLRKYKNTSNIKNKNKKVWHILFDFFFSPN